MSLMTAGAAAWRRGGAAPNPWPTVAIDLGFNGSNGGTSFPDASGRTWAPSGNAQTSTAEFVEGNASLLLDGSGDYLSTPSTADIQMQGDFRIECYVRPANVTRNMNIANKRSTGGSSQSEFSFHINASGLLRFIAWTAPNISVVDLTSPNPLAINQWEHVAVEKIGTQWSLIVGGATVAQDAQTEAPGVNNEAFYIGRDSNFTSRDFDGFIDHFRFLRP